MPFFYLISRTLSSFLVSDADFLHISPNRLQHFQLESISFQCTVGLLRLRRITDITDSDPKCDTTEKTSTGSSCKFDRAFSTDSGEYWCETEGGQQSNSVNITVTGMCVVFLQPIHVVPNLSVVFDPVGPVLSWMLN